VIILGLLDAELIQFRIQTTNAFKNGQIARFPERFTDHLSWHNVKIDHLSGQVK
jgi:hypothetical protein